MKKIIIISLFILLMCRVGFAEENITTYIPPIIVYYNETCPVDNITNISIYHDVRVIANIINITENRTSFNTEFTMFGEVVEQSCRISSIGEEDEHGRCTYNFPSEMWDDFIRYKLIPLPISEVERNNEFWNQTHQACEKSRKTRGIILLITYILIPVIVVGLFVYLRVKKYGIRGR